MSNNMTDFLLALAGTPTLPGARCRGRHHLFDPAETGEPSDTVEARHQQAIQLCQGCTALSRCAQWVETLPRTKRPGGVIAGQINHPRRAGLAS